MATSGRGKGILSPRDTRPAQTNPSSLLSDPSSPPTLPQRLTQPGGDERRPLDRRGERRPVPVPPRAFLRLLPAPLPHPLVRDPLEQPRQQPVAQLRPAADVVAQPPLREAQRWLRDAVTTQPFL